MINWFYDSYSVLSKVYSEKTFLKQAILKTDMEPKNRSLTVKTVYGVLEKDVELSYYLSSYAKKNPKLCIRIVLKIAMYAIKYLEKAPYAVIDNAVELVKKMGKGGASGFVNAFLRTFSSKPYPIPVREDEKLSVSYSYPLFALKRLQNDYDEKTVLRIISAKNENSTLVFYGVDGESYLSARGVKYSKTPFDGVFTVKNFVRNEDYDKGVYTFQNLGSVCIAEAVGEGERLLDVCAAPGGKSVYLSRKFSSVESYDIHPHRVELISSYAKRMGRENVRVGVMDGTKIPPEKYGAYDAVLCDVPCSGFGVVYDNPDIKLNREEDGVFAISSTQLSILKSACKAVKTGGTLVYSTCSVFASENQAIIKSFLSDIDGFSVVNCPPETDYIDTGYGYQILPSDISGGFFYCKLKKEF